MANTPDTKAGNPPTDPFAGVKKDVLTVKINSPEKILWEGEAKSVSSKNPDGPFDILPMHANFISLVENTPIRIIKADNSPVEYNFKTAVIYCHFNRVHIYTDL